MSSAPPPYPGTKGDPSYPPPGQPAYGQPPPPAGYAQPYGQPGYGQPYGPGQPGAPPPQGPTTTVVVAQPITVVPTSYREQPVHTRCPHCQAEIVTATEYTAGTMAWLICAGLCIIGCSLGCCLIPFCVDGCKDVNHSCPNCRQTIAHWSRM